MLSWPAVRKELLEQKVLHWSPETCQRFLNGIRASWFQFFQITLNYLLATLVAKYIENALTPTNRDVMRLVLRNGADPLFANLNGETMASKVFECTVSDIQVIRLFLSFLRDLNAPLNNKGKRAIHLICQYQLEPVLKLLLDLNPDLNVIDSDGLTGLHIVVIKREVRKMKMLVEAGADVNRADNRGNAVLHLSLMGPYRVGSITPYLIQITDVRARSSNGNTALHLLMASFRPFVVELLQLLLEKSADPSEPNNFGVTPLHLIIRHRAAYTLSRTIEIVKMLVAHGAAINAQDDNGHTVLNYHAIFENFTDTSPDLLIVLLELGADPNITTPNSKTVIDSYNKVRPHQAYHLMKYLVTKSFMREFEFGDRLMQSIESEEIYEEYLHLCSMELHYLGNIKFISTKPFTLLHVLTETSIEELVRFAKNDELHVQMSTFDIESFPNFGEELTGNYRRGCNVLKFRRRMIDIVDELSHGTMDYYCLENIVNYIPIEKLNRLVLMNDDPES